MCVHLNAVLRTTNNRAQLSVQQLSDAGMSGMFVSSLCKQDNTKEYLCHF